ncbi:MAG: hypothetical protein GXO21_06295 [Aquificae bacterium]|nr:hypothetical protein [Aquificota bacterium]
MEFFQGSKNKDDYIIKLDGKKVTDEHLFNCLYQYPSNRESAENLLRLIWKLGQIEDIGREEEVYNRISGLELGDNLKAYLFILWHRLIIDDISYPINRGYNGRKRLLAQVYLLLSKKFNFPLPQQVSYVSVSNLPRVVYQLGFPKGTGNLSLSKEDWNELYEYYSEFIGN